MTERRDPTERPRPVPGKRPRRSSRLRERNLLRNPLPLIAAAITIFLVVLTLLAARLTGTAGLQGTASQGATSVASTVNGKVRTIVRTTASGKTIVTRVAANGSRSTTAKQARLTTRTSGGGEDD